MEEIKKNPKVDNTNENNTFKKKIRRFLRCFCVECFLQKSNCELCNNCKFTVNINTRLV